MIWLISLINNELLLIKGDNHSFYLDRYSTDRVSQGCVLRVGMKRYRLVCMEESVAHIQTNRSPLRLVEIYDYLTS